MARRRKRGIAAAFSRVSKSIGRIKKRKWRRRSGPRGEYCVTHDPFSYSSDQDRYRRHLRRRLRGGK